VFILRGDDSIFLQILIYFFKTVFRTIMGYVECMKVFKKQGSSKTEFYDTKNMTKMAQEK